MGILARLSTLRQPTGSMPPYRDFSSTFPYESEYLWSDWILLFCCTHNSWFVVFINLRPYKYLEDYKKENRNKNVIANRVEIYKKIIEKSKQIIKHQ